MTPSPIVKEPEWVGNCLWSHDLELLVYMPDTLLPRRTEREDNFNRMLCPVSPFDFLEETLRVDRHYLET